MIDISDSTLRKTYGAIYTNPEVVNLILDLVGYSPDKRLHQFRLLDPAVGEGAFLTEGVKRLLRSYQSHGGMLEYASTQLADSVRGIEIHEDTREVCRANLYAAMVAYGRSHRTTDALLDRWLIDGDFLLWNHDRSSTDDGLRERFDFVVGNPPYVRQELIAPDKILLYRQQYATIYDRADLYVPFIEHGLDLLNHGGTLGFIVADRFMRNRYGKRLRELIVSRYRLKHVIDMHKTSPFADEVSAYPAVIVIENTEETRGPVHVVRMERVNETTCNLARQALLHGEESRDVAVQWHRFETWVSGDAPWILESTDYHNVLRKLEQQHPNLTDPVHGIRVGIGVATGADHVFIIDPVRQKLDVETQVLLPLVMTRDIAQGDIHWGGKYVINPFELDGSLINLDQLPRLRAYFDKHADTIKQRAIAKKSGANWYRTIDRIYPVLRGQPKLLIPDVKAANHIVKDSGKFYPHHNLYYVLPGVWNIDVLRAILLSSVARFFIWSYAVKMRGDFLRYQAQYLRRICLPRPESISATHIRTLKDPLLVRNHEALDQEVATIYGLTPTEFHIIQSTLA
ncbi:N-6 DNA methylase [Sulfobacillus sp. hq2]|uniref:Eco57I restriction-modification methylase domain-containing protein n=1 Tax=Sulfobacillus sp. hq2 TaxID=2039167 RepID=UPI000CD2667A|nr:N-6 DNA methylase [Sulfobacillus sp. hq2]POB10230.1 modification methylase PaeR7I [Sulfobacillus sp. hq2]